MRLISNVKVKKISIWSLLLLLTVTTTPTVLQ
jgi:hypothetical protein